ncbi:MAG: radical SAM protein [Nitrospirae bacterium]|nr:radical SAM protein [Nitrospirota bacterium]
MKILLLSPPYLPHYMRNARCDFVSLSKTQWYPIWLGYLGAFLEGKGHEVKLIDAPSYDYDHAKTEEIVLNYSPDFLVVYSGRLSEDNDVEFAERLVDRLGIEAVFAGPYVSINPEGLLKKTKKIKYAVKGEFEYPVLELIEGKKPSEIQNLLYKASPRDSSSGKGEEIRINKERPLLSGKELDAIPFVTAFYKKHLDLKKYKAPSEYYPFIDIMTGRGCGWGLCTYCLWVYTFIPGRNYNTRSIENVIEEFRYIKKEIPYVRSVMIQDDTFTDERAFEFSKGMIDAGIRLPWSCYSRGNMKYETLKLMKEAGCRNMHVGYESASNMVLKNIRKGLTKETMTEFTKNAHRAGLRIHADFAFGFDGETVDGMHETIGWAKELNPDTAQFQLMIPFPGTPYYDRLKEKGWINERGEPDFPGLSNEAIRKIAKEAYREFYLSFRHLKKALRHPYEHFFGRLDTIRYAIPAMFWKKW